MSESDFDMGLKRVHSRKEPVFQVVPKDIDFRLRIVDINSEPIGLLYTLKEGQTLPYEPDLEGNRAILNTIFLNVMIFRIQGCFRDRSKTAYG